MKVNSLEIQQFAGAVYTYTVEYPIKMRIHSQKARRLNKKEKSVYGFTSLFAPTQS
jgi:hypothetical protein